MEQLKARVPGLASGPVSALGTPIKVGREVSVDSVRGGVRPATGQC